MSRKLGKTWGIPFGWGLDVGALEVIENVGQFGFDSGGVLTLE